MFNPDPKKQRPPDQMSASEYQRQYGRSKPPKSQSGANVRKKRNKFGAIRQTYNGKSYDSKIEAAWAKHFDWLKKAGEVLSFEPQKTINIEVKGILIAKYAVDFFVTYSDGREEYVEVKGGNATMTKVWRLKWKLCKALYPQYNFVLKTYHP